MPDEIMKCFLEQIIECLDGISDALRLVLQYYHVSAAEKEFEKTLDGIETNSKHKGD